jgi:hypothetical protein
VSEWLKEHDWKSCMLLTGHRGFESLSLHQMHAHVIFEENLVWDARYGVELRVGEVDKK